VSVLALAITLCLAAIAGQLWCVARALVDIALAIRETQQRALSPELQKIAELSRIGSAIRERGPDLHVQLRDVPPARESER
jgi:hypothetical protein